MDAYPMSVSLGEYDETVWFKFFYEVSTSGTVSREELISEILLLKQSGSYSVNACEALSDWIIILSRVRSEPCTVQFFFEHYERIMEDYMLAKDHFDTLRKDDEFKDLCWTLYKQSRYKALVRCRADDFSFLFPGLMGPALFDFFCEVSNSGTVLREELISGFLQLKQSRFYSVSVCQAFSDWFIFSRRPRKRDSPGLSLEDYELAKAHFYTLANDDEFLSLCYSLHRWYQSGKKTSCKPLKLVPFDKRLLDEFGVLKGHADAIEEGLVFDGDGLIPVPNVSSYVLSQVILFLEKKQHFQETHDKAAAHYEGWSTAFFNRNSPIISELHQAAQDLQIPSLLESISKVQKRKDGGRLNDNLSSEMFHYFCGMAGNNKRGRAILEELNNIKLFRGLDKVACENFGKWFTQIGDLGRDHHNEFKTLMKSLDFSQVCLSLYRGDERLQFPQVSLKSQDGVILKMDKRVAVDESVFLRLCVRHSGWWTKIPVSIGSPVLSSVIDFCCKVWDFNKIYGSRRIKEGLVVVDHFRGWVTEFLKNNIDMLSELYEAADFLEIPSLLLLTTEEVTDLVTRPLDKASVLSGKLSFSRMLSSLFVKFTE
ncbi:uncharacterized protein LOC107496542 [Arachis duranensis]|uniref:Uncharacterized protein LOC107496542 n=1 Tax=Arachis duranensis TaxID=130453 RepID=A0A9C6TH53_ARADU|nr:uncharacterized protein LOC107496542 [Arachis duranensis]